MQTVVNAALSYAKNHAHSAMGEEAMDRRRRSIFLTGAASGMGAATARRFTREGWFVGCHDVDARGLEDLRAELGDEAGSYTVLDVTDASAFAEAITAFAATTDQTMDVLHNNAGIIAQGAFDEMEWTTIERIVRVNLFGVMIGVRAALPILKATPNALCFTTCSASAIFGSGGLAAYSVSKHALRGLTEALSIEFARFGIRVGDVLPGIIETAMVSPEVKPLLPLEGPWRLMPAEAVADAVWDAYHDCEERVHRYVPEELLEYDRLATARPEAVRDEARLRFGVG